MIPTITGIMSIANENEANLETKKLVNAIFFAVVVLFILIISSK